MDELLQLTLFRSPVVLLAAACCSCSHQGQHGEPAATSAAAIRIYDARPAVQFEKTAKFRILDADGRPLTSGFAWLSVFGAGITTEVSARQAIDPNGIAVLSLGVNIRKPLAYQGLPMLWVVDNQSRILKADISADALAQSAAMIEVRLPLARELANVVVLDPAGAPVAHARVAADATGFSDDDMGDMVPDEVWAAASMLTDATGRCKVELPIGLNRYLRIETNGFGIQALEALEENRGLPPIFRLGKCARFIARVTADSPAAVRLEALSHRMSGDIASGDSARAKLEIRPGEEGTALLLAGGKLALRPQVDPRSDLVAAIDDAPARMAEDEPTRITIRVQPAIMARGRVVKGPNKIPVERANVRFYGSSVHDSVLEAITGADGVYKIACGPGKLISIGAVTLPGSVSVFVKNLESQIAADSKTVSLPDVELPEFVWLHGTLKDGEGQPVANEDISYGDDPTQRLSTTTGLSGEFWLPVQRPVSESSFHLVGRAQAKVIEHEPLVLQMPNRRKNAPAAVRLVAE